MNTKTLTAVALLLAAIPAASFAQDAATPARPTPPVLDFAAADTDGSGGISTEEWSAYATTLRDARRAEMIGARADALIAAADADGNGALTRDELVTGMTAMGEERRDEMRERFAMGRHGGDERGPRMGHGDDRGERHEMRGERGERHERGERGERAERGERGDRGERRMAGMHDRMGERGERGGMGFARIDADSDGQISPEELAHAQEMINWMASRPQRG
ncbi:hypothetical protein [Pararhodobacter sp. CCB-MM2]|uniref:hypothetical protein n=1 Tax=Pararhodobacter sp. CCB-MM2 TaxID=1786003 RepID=UPI000829DD2D|nr:hypothetical protein [Pararhodobacter sp. CCB-MM2]